MPAYIHSNIQHLTEPCVLVADQPAKFAMTGDGMMLFRHMYFVRFCLVNIIASALALAAYCQGWLDGVLAAHLF